MAIRVLGPLDTGTERRLSPRERVMLAALIVRTGRAVAPGELAEACWGTDAPRTWPQQVKTSVARIRAGLGSSAVVTRGSSYTLGLDPATIDAFEFERLVSAAREHALHDEHDRAVDAYRRALGLWRGEPYAELDEWEPAAAEAERLAAIRDSAQEELLESCLAEGEHRAVIADAERLVRAAPLREDRAAILAIANYRAGRQAEALATVRAARERLADELGIDVGQRLRALESSILRQDPSLAAVRALHRVSDTCPYRGLTAFSPADAEDFFGREREIEAIRDRIRPGEMLVVVGASGSGKSSLVLAGVLPRTAEGRRVAVVTAGRDAAVDLRARIAEHDIADLVIVDQAEAVFQLAEPEQAQLCLLVAEMLAAGAAVIITLRSDFLDRATGLPHVGALVGGAVYAIGPLSADGLREAIERPAARAGLRLEAGLVELIVRDAGDRRATLPHVSHALVETWVRREGSTMTVAGYEASGGIAGGIAQSAETLYRSLDDREATACRALLLRLVQRPPDGASVRRVAHLEPLVTDDARRHVLDRLVAARLLTIDGETVVVAHEAVAEAWPRLDGWLEDDVEGARVMASVATAAELWDADGRRDEDLLRGARLQAAAEWLEASAGDLTDVEREYVAASTAYEQDEMRALADHAARESRSNTRLRWALSGAGALLVVALISGGIAVVRGQDAAAAGQEQLVEAITSRAKSLVGTDRDVAALMAVEAYHRWPDDARTRDALMASVTTAGGFEGSVFVAGTDERIGAWPIPGTEEVAVVRDKSVLEIRSLTSGAVMRPIADDFPAMKQLVRPWVRVSADRSTIVVMQHADEIPAEDVIDDMERDELLHVFDVESGRRIGRPIAVPEWGESVEISPDGRLVTWASNGTVVVVRTGDGVVTRVPFAADRPLESLPSLATSSFTPDGRIVVTDVDGHGALLDPATLATTMSFTVPAEAGGWSVVATPDVIVTDGIRMVAAVDAATGTELWRRDHIGADDCRSMAASPVQQLLFCLSPDGRLLRRDLESGAFVGGVVQHQQGGGDIALTAAQDEVIVMASVTPMISRFDAADGGPVSRSIGPPRMVAATGPDPGGRYIVLNSQAAADVFERDLLLWDMRNEAPVGRLDEIVRLPGVDDGTAVDTSWIRPGVLSVIVYDPAADAEHRVVFDVAGRRILDAPQVDDIVAYWPAPGGDSLYGLVLSVDGDPNGPQHVVRIDARTLARLDGEIALDGGLQTLTPLPDGSGIVATMWIGDGWLTAVYDNDGTQRAAGLPTSSRSTVTDAGEIVANTMTELRRYTLDLEPLGPLPAGVNQGMDLSTAGSTLLAWSRDPGIAVIDLESRRQLGGWIPSNASATIVWPDADGTGFLASGARHVAHWTLDPDAHAAAACRIAGRELTAEEWSTYLGDLGAQHPICADILLG
ncbi:BTAD domain-containing putative transcriptional regulator [Microbacterium sp. NPDC056044]|uniref:nSTAND1 domain-containing NTPase n=1 Tax=Microbacterium sp. NPDC056044 TaxID=3345690 RepID=UPI0035D88549